VKFKRANVVLLPGTYCPFNSQNTIWWPEAYPLLYLPSYVSFRMTDIWRSFVAQICLHRVGKPLAFRSPTVFQERNEHSFIRDFKDEIPGYLNNANIMRRLESLELSNRFQDIGKNLLRCYEELAATGLIPSAELLLVHLWLDEIGLLSTAPPPVG
jgi:hypothetical protein